MKPAQLKKKLAAITSVLGNIEAHFPSIKNSFIQALQMYHPELLACAAEKKLISHVDAAPIDVETHEGLTDVFIASLRVRSPELFVLGVQEGIIPGTYSMPTAVSGCNQIVTDMRGLRGSSKGISG